MINFLEQYFNCKFVEVKNENEASHIYSKTKNLEKLVSIKSLDLLPKEVSSICGKLNDNKIYYKIKPDLSFDIILGGMVKIRLIDIQDNLVKTISKVDHDKSAQLDAEIRTKHSLLPVPRIFEISDQYVLEELIINTNTREQYISHPEDVLKALYALIPAVCECFEKRGNHFYSIINGQLYKNDHLLFKDTQLYIVDWSEGGNKDANGKSYIFFDIISSLKWSVFASRYRYFYYVKYVNEFISIAFEIAKNINMVEWKKELLWTIDMLSKNEKWFSNKSFLIKNLKYRIKKYND